MDNRPRRRLGFAAMVLVLAGLAACGKSSRLTATNAAPTTTAAPPPAATSATQSTDLAVNLAEFKVDLPQTTLPAATYHLTIKNTGTVQHELLVFKSDLARSAYPVANGDIQEDGPGVTKISDGDNIGPGASQTRSVDLSTPGTYLFVCNLPGHFKAGMSQVVTVTPPSATANPNNPSVSLVEFKLDMPQTTFSPGLYTFNVRNSGKIQHELLVFKSDLAPTSYPLLNGNIQEDGPGIDKISDGDNLDPAGSQTRTVDLTKPGTYLFVCNLPGHFKAGMYDVVTVR